MMTLIMIKMIDDDDDSYDDEEEDNDDDRYDDDEWSVDIAVVDEDLMNFGL